MSVMSLVVAILPIILIGLFIYKKDRDKESSKLLFKLFAFGIISCFPAVFFSLLLGGLFPAMEDMNFVQLLVYVFVSIAFVEEACKWFFTYNISYNHSEFDTLYDMIVYASFVALGFACFENVLYVYSYGIETGLFRAISAVPSHVCDGILMGSYLSLAKINQVKGNEKQAKKYKKLSLIIPVIVHGIYDFCIFWGSTLFTLLFFIFVITLFIICFKKVKEISKNDVKFIFKNKNCTNCNTLVDTNYCPNCGTKNT